MAEKPMTLTNEIVKKSNALARARWAAESVWEPRLVALLASKVKANDTDFHVYEIPVAEVMRCSAGGKDYREIEAVVDRVMSRVITIRDEHGWEKFNVFSRCRYRAKDAVLELGFHPDLRSHYLNLKKCFTQYSLFEFLKIPSLYSQRMFELLKSWSDKKNVVINIDELYDILDVPKSHRSDFRNFRIRVLEKSYKDIHKYTSFVYEWEAKKNGRKVVSIQFSFCDDAMGKAKKIHDNEAKKKKSAQNNRTVLAAKKCFAAGSCKPTKSKKCEVCRLYFQKKI